MDQPTRFVLQQVDTFCIVEVGDGGYETRDAFHGVLLCLAVEDVLLDPVLQTLVCKVHAKLSRELGLVMFWGLGGRKYCLLYEGVRIGRLCRGSVC